MILDGILNLLLGILQPVVNALPKGHLPSGWFDTANGFGGYIGSIDKFVPISAPLSFMVTMVVATVPALITAQIAVWVFNKIRGA